MLFRTFWHASAVVALAACGDITGITEIDWSYDSSGSSYETDALPVAPGTQLGGALSSGPWDVLATNANGALAFVGDYGRSIWVRPVEAAAPEKRHAAAPGVQLASLTLLGQRDELYFLEGEVGDSTSQLR